MFTEANLLFKELQIAQRNFCTGWLGGDVPCSGDKIGEGLYIIRKVGPWTSGVCTLPHQQQKAREVSNQGPQWGPAPREHLPGVGGVPPWGDSAPP